MNLLFGPWPTKWFRIRGLYNRRASIMTVQPSGYHSTAEKDAVREQFDLPLLESFSTIKDKKLRYFGLPGAECLDISTWSDVLCAVDAVERDFNNLVEMRRFLEMHFGWINPRFHFGDIDQVIMNDYGNEQDSGGQPHTPRVGTVFDEDLELTAWEFDIVNLDYFGPFLPRFSRRYPTMRDSRSEAIMRLFSKDRLDARDSWLLLMTVEADRYEQGDLDQLRLLLQDFRSESSLEVSNEIDELLRPDPEDAYTATKLVHGVLAVMIASAASDARLEVQSRGTVCYPGTNGRNMVHLAFQFDPTSGPLVRHVPRLPLLQAPLLRLSSDGNAIIFDWAISPSPGATRPSVSACLDFLDSDALCRLLESVSG